MALWAFWCLFCFKKHEWGKGKPARVCFLNHSHLTQSRHIYLHLPKTPPPPCKWQEFCCQWWFAFRLSTNLLPVGSRWSLQWIVVDGEKGLVYIWVILSSFIFSCSLWGFRWSLWILCFSSSHKVAIKLLAKAERLCKGSTVKKLLPSSCACWQVCSLKVDGLRASGPAADGYWLKSTVSSLLWGQLPYNLLHWSMQAKKAIEKFGYQEESHNLL